MALTEKGIQHAIMRMVKGANDIVMPNFTPRLWWECDVARITPAGYLYEYEIKLTVSDYRADARKFTLDHYLRKPEPRRCANRVEVNKCELLASNDDRGPKEFWYVLPEGMILTSEVRAFAGVLWAKEDLGRVVLNVQRRAPRRKVKPIEGICQHATTNASYRYMNMLLRGKF